MMVFRNGGIIPYDKLVSVIYLECSGINLLLFIHACSLTKAWNSLNLNLNYVVNTICVMGKL